jgi:hypothetical protein
LCEYMGRVIPEDQAMKAACRRCYLTDKEPYYMEAVMKQCMYHRQVEGRFEKGTVG